MLYLKVLTTRDLGDTQYKIRQPARTVYSYDCHNSWATLLRKYNLLEENSRRDSRRFCWLL